MRIIFTTWEEWNDTLTKMNAGMVVCPDCRKWVNELHKIPEECRHLSYRHSVYWVKQRKDFETEEDRQRVLDNAEWHKEKTEYCCGDCMSIRVYRKTELDMEETHDKCDSCKQWFAKGTLQIYQRNRVAIPPYLCPTCLEAYIRRDEFLKATANERRRVNAHNKRTAALGLPSDLTIEEWLDVIESYGNVCAVCGDAWTDLDHIIPVSKGGGTTKSNVRPLCKHCNCVKHDRDVAINHSPIERI